MNNSFLNRHVLKPETIRQVEAAGPVVSQIVDRWAGGWPKKTQKLEKSGQLLAVAQSQAEQERMVDNYLRDFPDVGRMEALQVFDLPQAPRCNHNRIQDPNPGQCRGLGFCACRSCH